MRKRLNIMEVEERLARIEAIVGEEDGIERLERKALKIAKCFLLIVALLAPAVWALSEFVSFLINRFESLRHALGW
jgi:hypothetical protein